MLLKGSNESETFKIKIVLRAKIYCDIKPLNMTNTLTNLTVKRSL